MIIHAHIMYNTFFNSVYFYFQFLNVFRKHIYCTFFAYINLHMYGLTYCYDKNMKICFY